MEWHLAQPDLDVRSYSSKRHSHNPLSHGAFRTSWCKSFRTWYRSRTLSKTYYHHRLAHIGSSGGLLSQKEAQQKASRLKVGHSILKPETISEACSLANAHIPVQEADPDFLKRHFWLATVPPSLNLPVHDDWSRELHHLGQAHNCSNSLQT